MNHPVSFREPPVQTLPQASQAHLLFPKFLFPAFVYICKDLITPQFVARVKTLSETVLMRADHKMSLQLSEGMSWALGCLAETDGHRRDLHDESSVVRLKMSSTVLPHHPSATALRHECCHGQTHACCTDVGGRLQQ